MEILIVVVLIVLVVLLGLFFVMRRRRESAEVLPPPELGQPIDYTSLPYQEPTTWSDRFRNASPATKLLIVLLPLVAIISLVVLVITLQPTGGGDPALPTPEPASLAITTASVVGPGRILVQADTNLPSGTAVTAALLQDGQPFDWYQPDTARADVTGGRVRITLEQRSNAPAPAPDQEYAVVLSATDSAGQTITTEPAQVEVPERYSSAFYVEQAQPTAVAAGATAAPTRTPAPPTAAPARTSAPTATPAPTITLTATVRNGGNIRQQPNLQGQVLGQINFGEVVVLREKSADGQWYSIDAPEAEGWVSVTLLTIPAEVAAQVPVEGQTTQPTAAPAATAELTGVTTTVFNGGNVRAAPSLQGQVLDQINAGERVELRQKTANGQWYEIVNIRGVTGWVSVSLLNIDDELAAQVPVAQ